MGDKMVDSILYDEKYKWHVNDKFLALKTYSLISSSQLILDGKSLEEK